MIANVPHPTRSRLVAVLAGVVLLVGCSDGPAGQPTWTPAQRAVFEAFRTTKGNDRLELAREVVDVLPHVLDSVTLKIRASPESLPIESDVLNQLGPPGNSFSLDHQPEYMGGKVSADVNRRDYRVHIYEVGCYEQTASIERATSGPKISCSTLELVAFRGHVVAALVAHDTPESVRRWLSVH